MGRKQRKEEEAKAAFWRNMGDIKVAGEKGWKRNRKPKKKEKEVYRDPCRRSKKKWASDNGLYLDLAHRDAPTMLLGGDLYIGTKKDTHGSLVCNVLYGMDAEIPGDDITQDNKEYEDKGLIYYRKDIEKAMSEMKEYNEEETLYGHLLKGVIYWDCQSMPSYDHRYPMRSKHKMVNILNRNMSKSMKDYKHMCRVGWDVYGL